MAFEPNPFVNPSQRGFELPPGCKDLMDVLARAAVGELIPSARVEAGNTSTLRAHIGRFYQSKSPREALTVMNVENKAILILTCEESRFKLTLLVQRGSAFLENTIVELFGEAALAYEGLDELRTVKVPLPDLYDDAAQSIIDLLIRGYGMLEGARLMLVLQARK